MEASKVIDTHITTATQLDMDESGSPVNQTMYRGIIGSLFYLTASRPDILFSVGLCAMFQLNPKESHLKAAKRILRYLKGTQVLVLYYPSGDNFNLIWYADNDYAGYLVDMKSTSGMAHFLGSCLISWGIRKQNSMALSTAEAEYVAVASCCAALNMAKNPMQQKKIKHIDARHHFLRDNVEKGLICMEFCSTKDQIADIFTKALSREYFERNRLDVGLIKPN
ncbi:secreted RxLR effector protein 161-like [Nicotiana sylvestris]|uniref:secreted RxLR effector protein 161-like n=1 Tax=Nicotiana sylvestris TaxID=4096 RepID=UPI00388CAC1F